MATGQGQELKTEPTKPGVDSPTSEWIVPAILLGLMVTEGLRQGGFWRADALIAAVAAVLFLAVGVVIAPPDRRSWWVIVSVLLLALWWFIRAQTSGSLVQFLPLGASFLAFAAAFVVVRPLKDRVRALTGLGIACLGAAGALIGFVGLIWRWYPMAMPAQGLWRLSGPLTYADAAGLLFGVSLLVALGTDVSPVAARIAVCLCAGGLLATQSRGAYVAVVCACCLVPWHRYVRHLVPLVAGVGLGVVAIVTSPDTGHVPWLGVVLVLSVAVAAAAPWNLANSWSGRRARSVIVVGLLVATAGSLLLLRHEIGLRAFSPSDQDRSVEWSTALHQWKSAPILGVGPDRLLQFHAPDGTYAHFVHNEFLQIGADAGVIGVMLLLVAAISVLRVARRFDVLSSCASAGLLCWAVAAVFDFDWHLTFIGFLGGCCLGLASETEEEDEEFSQGGHRRRGFSHRFRSHLPVGRRIAQ
jgi:O-Antigen ligase